jgi:hypothetical protein
MAAQYAPVISSLDDLLHRICINLQLSLTDYSLAVEHYQAIGNYLESKDSPVAQYHPNIYPQGSLRIGTTVKPHGKQEYDLDIVCEMSNLEMERLSNPVSLLTDIEDWLKKNGRYKDKVERMNRCVRVNYDYQFHLDILPAQPDEASGYCCVLVPDCKLDDWKPSNPKGYAEWFDAAAEYSKFELVMEAAEPLPAHEPIEFKPPLKRAVQLLKRYRDMTLGYDSKAAISIVLTTLSARNYVGQQSVNDTLLGVLEGIVAGLPSQGIMEVRNPMNHNELLSERWNSDPKLYDEFKEWIIEFRNDWRAINSAKGLPSRMPLLGKLFGEERVNIALEDQAEAIHNLRPSSSIGVKKASGIITIVDSAETVPVLKNNYYGEE